MLLALAAIWGASFLFIKVAVWELTPATLIVGRLGLAALTLALIAPAAVGARETLRQFREHWLWLVVVALVNTAIPFWLLSWGETRIDSGLASIIQASVPIFNALIAFVAFHEVRVTGSRLVGVGVGFVGVALLVGAQPEGKVLGALSWGWLSATASAASSSAGIWLTFIRSSSHSHRPRFLPFSPRRPGLRRRSGRRSAGSRSSRSSCSPCSGQPSRTS